MLFRKSTFALFSLIVMLSSLVLADSGDYPAVYSNISDGQRKEIEQIIDEYLLRDDTRSKMANAGLVSPFYVYWDSGLRIRSEDNNFKLKIGGRIMNDWGWFDEESEVNNTIGDQVDGTEFRRARLYMAGTIYGNINFKAQYDFASGGRPDFKDVWLELAHIPYVGHFRVGHFKEPFSLENLTSSKYITFMERSLNNVFAPSRNTGFMLHNYFLNKRMTYAAGVFRNSDEFGDSEGDESTEGGYSYTARVTGLPVYKDDGRKLIHAGFSFSAQNAFENNIRYRQKPEMHMADRFVDTGNFADAGNEAEWITLFNPEFAVVYGPFSFQTEYTFANIDLKDDTASSDPSYTSWYAYGSYFLTGEHRKYKNKTGAFNRIKPIHNFDWHGGWGAIELKARYSEIDLNDEEVNGGRLADITLGVNWYLNPNTRVMFDYVHADVDRRDLGLEDGEADLFATRFQIDF